MKTAFDEACVQGARAVCVAPIGFLADHVEILYDLDIEASKLAEERGLRFSRMPSLNSDDDFIEVLAEVARPLLEAGG